MVLLHKDTLHHRREWPNGRDIVSQTALLLFMICVCVYVFLCLVFRLFLLSLGSSGRLHSSRQHVDSLVMSFVRGRKTFKTLHWNQNISDGSPTTQVTSRLCSANTELKTAKLWWKSNSPRKSVQTMNIWFVFDKKKVANQPVCLFMRATFSHCKFLYCFVLFFLLFMRSRSLAHQVPFLSECVHCFIFFSLSFFQQKRKKFNWRCTNKLTVTLFICLLLRTYQTGVTSLFKFSRQFATVNRETTISDYKKKKTKPHLNVEANTQRMCVKNFWSRWNSCEKKKQASPCMCNKWISNA